MGTGPFGVLSPASTVEQEATVICAMTRMGMADALGTCLLTSIRDSSRQHINNEIVQVRRDLWQFEAL